MSTQGRKEQMNISVMISDPIMWRGSTSELAWRLSGWLGPTWIISGLSMLQPPHNAMELQQCTLPMDFELNSCDEKVAKLKLSDARLTMLSSLYWCVGKSIKKHSCCRDVLQRPHNWERKQGICLSLPSNWCYWMLESR